ncbi:hypothetical protein CCM_03793 [Cordyceps militaris CM01]|uniref:Uncharacterized protein n=1 Tax=Cordyceps militaris (strain CM01) TaxID=983644 RepID=G3JGQ6_CORMM|nr:uncharacterized protein CCM_03793 [Cordyceps militaris CM01]EGX92420.1 hypothetical protein CCM_03793 [Cordyceps militaris CM01]
MAAMPKRVTDNPWSLLAHLDVAAGSKTDPVLAFLPWGKDSGGAAGPKCVEARELASLQAGHVQVRVERQVRDKSEGSVGAGAGGQGPAAKQYLRA